MHTRRTFLFGLFGTILSAAAFTAVNPASARAQAPGFDVRGTWVHEAGYATATLILRPDGTFNCLNVDRLSHTRTEDRGTWVQMHGTIITTDSAGVTKPLYVFPIRPDLATFRIVVAPGRPVDLTFGRMR